MFLTNHTQHIIRKRVGDTLGGDGDVYNLDGDDTFIGLPLSLISSSCIQEICTALYMSIIPQ